VNWIDQLETEIGRGKQAEAIGNAGKVRTCARRSVGIVVTEYQKRTENKYGNDVMRQLGGLASDTGLPQEVRKAAERLQSRLSQDFTSPSEHPLEDALVIINFFRQKLSL
jgi:hypothetical protein